VIAVIAVILCHAGWGMAGGYVGGDVFFVISGSLITGQIAADLDRGTFSLARFWNRRIRRIWPATLGLVMIALPCFLLCGDSHGMAISPAIDALADEIGLSAAAAFQVAALPLPTAWQPNARSRLASRQGSQEWTAEIIRWMRADRPRPAFPRPIYHHGD